MTPQKWSQVVWNNNYPPNLYNPCRATTPLELFHSYSNAPITVIIHRFPPLPFYHTGCCIDLTSRSWRTRKANRTNTHIHLTFHPHTPPPLTRTTTNHMLPHGIRRGPSRSSPLFLTLLLRTAKWASAWPLQWVPEPCQKTPPPLQYLRSKPSYEFHFEGFIKFQLFGGRVGSNPRCQSKNIEMKYKTHIELVHELYGTCFQHNVRN